MNLRRRENTLGNIDIRRLEDAKHRAAKLGRPLNTFLTYNPARGGEPIEADSAADLFGVVRNRIQLWVRRHKVAHTAIWTAEAKPDGSGPHMHMLLHLPARLLPGFRDALERVYPGRDAGGSVIDVRRDDGKVTYRRDIGRVGSRFHYMIKQMSSQAYYARSFRVTMAAPGPFVGRRFGMTANIFVSEAEIVAARAASKAQQAVA